MHSCFREPHYLNSLLIHRIYSHFIRSSTFYPLIIPFFNKMSNGFHFFAYAAPFLWNHLPDTVRSVSTYLSLEKTLKHISLIKHFCHRLSSP